MRFLDVLETLRADAPTEREKGARFERLFARWLRADPTRASEIEQVWLWEDVPARGALGSRDLGIDLVARTFLGEYQAYQCKFYSENTMLDEVASFLSNSSRRFPDPISGEMTGFSSRFLVSTNDGWSPNARKIMRNQETPVQIISFQSFADSEVDWESLLRNEQGKRPKKEPRDYQLQIIKKAQEHFLNAERGQLIMACGTGKTFTSLNIAEKLLADGSGRVSGTVLFLVPSIALLNQTLNAWMADARIPLKAVCVCSDHTASRKRDEDEAVIELALPATTRPGEIARRLRDYENLLAGDGIVAVFSTYQSLAAVYEAQEILRAKGDWQFDLIICDEAHRTSGAVAAEKYFTRIHDGSYIRGKKRLYMTATPKIYAAHARAQAKERKLGSAQWTTPTFTARRLQGSASISRSQTSCSASTRS